MCARKEWCGSKAFGLRDDALHPYMEARRAGKGGREGGGWSSSLQTTYAPPTKRPQIQRTLILLAPMMPHHQGVELQHHPGTRDGREAAHNVVEAVAVCQLLFLVVGS